MSSPMQPVAPPTKKIKGVDSVDSVRKRRDELDRLKKKQEMRSAKGVPSRAPPPPGVAPIDRVRHSDIFPGVDKVAKTTREPPPKSSRMQAPPPRRLAESFERRGTSPVRAASPSRADRSKSAPPSRPPPPPGPPPAVKDDATPRRGFTPRPPAVTSGVTGVKTPKPMPPPIAAGLSASSPPPPVTTPKAPPTPPTTTTTTTPKALPSIATPAPPKTTPKAPPLVATPAPPMPPTLANAPPSTPRLTPTLPGSGSAPPTPPTPQLAPPTIPFMTVPTVPAPVPAPMPLPGTAPHPDAGVKSKVESSNSPEDVGPAPVPAPFPVASFEPEKPTILPPPPTNTTTAAKVMDPTLETKIDMLPPPSAPPAAAPEDTEGPPANLADLPGPPTKVAEGPSKSRQTLISNMHQYAETPSKHDQQEQRQESSKTETSLLRLEKEVREHEKAKAEALRRVVELEEEVQKLKELGAASHIATETPKASTAQVGFFSPLSPGLATPRGSTHRRVATPHPKYRFKKSGEARKDNEESLSDSVNYIPFEYTTELATFIIRRPYGKASERELWFEAGYSNSKQYEKTADVNKPQTLEIVAQVVADGSLLSLHGESFVRHRSNDDDADWREYGNADALEKPLGNVTYIDSDTSEKDYSLDDIYEGAKSTRENYCVSVIGMGAGSQAKGEIPTRGKKGALSTAPPATAVMAPAVQKPTAEIGVGTEDLPFPAPALGAPTTDGGPPCTDANPGKAGQDQTPPHPPPAFEEDEGSDSLADDNGANGMGAAIDTMFNGPGIV